MCGIFSYAGNQDSALTIVNGLKRLEYRGYDSWGIAVSGSTGIQVIKNIGAINDAAVGDKLSRSRIGIGHTRWATHGGVTTTNAHPHLSSDSRFALAHNGIVENYQALKATLIDQGYSFHTQTDTEVIVRLIESKLTSETDIQLAIISAHKELRGRNTIIILDHQDNQLLAIRSGSPLVVGVSPNEYYLASDALSFADHTNQVVFVDDGQMAMCKSGELRLVDVTTLQDIAYTVDSLDHKVLSINKDGYPYFMLKEIFEQRHTLVAATNYSREKLEPILKAISKATTIFTLGSGGAFYAADQMASMLRDISGKKALGIRAYDLANYQPLIESNDVVIAISQSGETADTIQALETMRKRGLCVVGVVNMMGSTISRMSDISISSRSGSEICVLSTKSSTAQMAFGYLLAQTLAGHHTQAQQEIADLAKYLADEYLTKSLDKRISDIASRIVANQHIFLLGKGRNHLIAQLGALNIKEASYIHAEGFSAGELKHGVIALIAKHTPVICFVDSDNESASMLNAAAEVKSRGAYVLGIATEPNELFDDFIELPHIPNNTSTLIAHSIPCQLLAYHLAVIKGHNPDRPRNLAKSVTVL